MLISREVSIGSGTQFFTAIEVATGFGLLENSGLPVDRVELAKLCRRAETNLSARGSHYGRFVSCCGQTGQAAHVGLPVPGLSGCCRFPAM